MARGRGDAEETAPLPIADPPTALTDIEDPAKDTTGEAVALTDQCTVLAPPPSGLSAVLAGLVPPPEALLPPGMVALNIDTAAEAAGSLQAALYQAEVAPAQGHSLPRAPSGQDSPSDTAENSRPSPWRDDMAPALWPGEPIQQQRLAEAPAPPQQDRSVTGTGLAALSSVPADKDSAFRQPLPDGAGEGEGETAASAGVQAEPSGDAMVDSFSRLLTRQIAELTNPTPGAATILGTGPAPPIIGIGQSPPMPFVTSHVFPPPPEAQASVLAEIRLDRQDATTMEVTLPDADFGPMRLELSRHGEALRIVVAAERSDTVELMRRHSDSLIADLRQAGFSGTDLSFGQWQRGSAPAPGQEPPPLEVAQDRPAAGFSAATPIWAGFALPGRLHLRI